MNEITDCIRDRGRMFGQDRFETLFVVFAFFMQVALIVLFALRKWSFESAMRYGWIISRPQCIAKNGLDKELLTFNKAIG